MGMELINLLRILRRWLWLILSIVLVTGLVLWFRLRSAEPVYEAQVKLQLSTPQQEAVMAFDQYRYISLRDEVTVARNNFTEVLQSERVYNWTIRQFASERNDATYDLDVNLVRDADFMYVIVKARTSELAAEIANTHVNAAIAYYGDLRAKPTSAEKSLFAEQLRIAAEEFRAAEDAFAEFKARNGVASLGNELATYQELLKQLQLERDRLMLEEPTNYVDPVGEVDKLIAQRQKDLDRLAALAPTYNVLEENAQQAREKYRQALNPYNETEPQANVVQTAEQLRIAAEEFRAAEDAFAEFKAQNGIASLENELATYQVLLEQLKLERDGLMLEELTRYVDPAADADKLIAQRQEELDRLAALAPMYNVLEENARQARENYQHVQDKYTEAELKANVVQAASFIQIIEPAQAPPQPVSDLKKLLVLGLAGSLGSGVLLAFLFEYISGFETARVVPAGAELETSPPAELEEALEMASSTAPTGGKAEWGTYSGAK
jgi:uncharacterized protein involved in exopolysaccharide biosynthesis